MKHDKAVNTSLHYPSFFWQLRGETGLSHKSRVFNCPQKTRIFFTLSEFTALILQTFIINLCSTRTWRTCLLSLDCRAADTFATETPGLISEGTRVLASWKHKDRGFKHGICSSFFSDHRSTSHWNRAPVYHSFSRSDVLKAVNDQKEIFETRNKNQLNFSNRGGTFFTSPQFLE